MKLFVIGVVPDPDYIRCNEMAKLPHFTEDGSCYFLTSTTYGRKPLFKIDRFAQILCNIIYNLRNKGKLSLLGFVIMPEHLHLMLVPTRGVKISWIMQEIKKGSARLINRECFCRAQGRAQLPNADQIGKVFGIHSICEHVTRTRTR
jgi:REP element-mobilizing transposase RayT